MGRANCHGANVPPSYTESLVTSGMGDEGREGASVLVTEALSLTFLVTQ